MATAEHRRTFWSAVDAELAAVPAQTDVARDARPSVGGIAVARVTFTSLAGVRVAAWLSMPDTAGPHPGLLVLPGYKSDPLPGVFWARRGFAVMTLAHRGKLGAISAFDPGYPGVLVDGIGDPHRYAYRGIYADSVRAIEVLETLPGVAEGSSAVFGYSQGGPLAIVAAARRSERVRALAVGAPFLTAFPYSVAATRTYPYREIAEILLTHPERRDEIFETLSYFDTLGFAHALTMPTLVYRGSADEICPPLSASMLYERIDGPKQWLEYPDAAHGGTNQRSLPDVAEFLSEGVALSPPKDPSASLTASATDRIVHATIPATTVTPTGRSDHATFTVRPDARTQRVVAHAPSARLDWIELAARHPARATLHWVSFDTADDAVAGAYLSVPTDSAAASDGVLVQFPGYESVVSVPHPEDRERFTILTLAHRGQRGRGFSQPLALPGLIPPSGTDRTWTLEHVVDDCLLGLELLLGHADASGPVIGVGPDWSLLVAASTRLLTHLEVDDYWIEGFDPHVEEVTYPRRELTELVAEASPEQLEALTDMLAALSPSQHARGVTLDLLLVTGDDAAIRSRADTIADAHAGSVERHRTHRDSAIEAEWRDARRSALLGVGPAQRWRYARAGIHGP